MMVPKLYQDPSPGKRDLSMKQVTYNCLILYDFTWTRLVI